MLGKLLKYEWKSTGRILPLIYLAVLVLSVFVGISFRNNMVWDRIPWGNLIFFSIYMILIVAMAVVTIVVIIERFYKSMISQEGYLMHTLPVKPWQHIISKLCMAIIWVAIAIVVVVLSILIIGGASGVLTEVLAELDISLMLNEMEYLFGDNVLDILIICGIVQGIRLILQVYAAMAIGGSATKNKIAYSFLAFVVIAVIVSVIASIISMGAMMGMFASANGIMELFMGAPVDEAALNAGFDGMFGGLYAMQLVMDGAFAVVFFFVTNHFLSKRLNLE